MAGLDPAIHAVRPCARRPVRKKRRRQWMPGSSPLLSGLDWLDRAQVPGTVGISAHRWDRDTDHGTPAYAVLVPLVFTPDSLRAPTGGARRAWRGPLHRHASSPYVVPGLDPGIHGRRMESRVRPPPSRSLQTDRRACGGRMDGRIKSGHDGVVEAMEKHGEPGAAHGCRIKSGHDDRDVGAPPTSSWPDSFRPPMRPSRPRGGGSGPRACSPRHEMPGGRVVSSGPTPPARRPAFRARSTI